MHKSTILGLSLVSMLFLAATTGMSMQVSAIQETEKLQSFSGSKKNDDKVVCRDGPFRGFYVVDPRACHVDIPPDPELLCEECIKYWLNFLNSKVGNNPSQTLTLINALANAINHKNFDFGQGQTCERQGEKVNPLRGVECLPVVQQNNIKNAAQVFEICKQLELALKYLDRQPNTTPLQALIQIGRDVVNFPGTDQTIDNVVIGLFECFAESLLPVLFPPPKQPIRASEESSMIQQYNQENTIVQQQSIDQQQQQQIEQIQQQIQQSLGQEKQQQSTQQQGPSSISQEQMHQQQIVKLKQFLELVR